MKTLNIQISEAEFTEFGFEKQTLSLKELIKILSKSAFPTRKSTPEISKSETPLVDSITGIISLPKDFDYRAEVANEKIINPANWL